MYNHKKSKKHENNEYIYKKQNSYTFDIIKKKDEEIEKLKEKLVEVEKIKELEIQELKTTLKFKELETKASIYKEFAERPTNTTTKTINNHNTTNNLNYVNTHYKNAPPLTKLTDFILNGIDLDDKTQLDELSELITYTYNNKSLHKCIGDHIIKNYKKDDKTQQSFHTTDVARKKYIVKLDKKMKYLYDSEDSEEPIEGTNKDNSKWITDNDGVKISYLLYNPMIKKVLKKLKKICKRLSKRNVEDLTQYDFEKITTLSKLIKDVDKDKLKNDINKYIAPHFELNKV
jgi:hypothetical protein